MKNSTYQAVIDTGRTTLLDTSFSEYRARIEVINGEVVWFQGDEPILSCYPNHGCPLVEAVDIKGFNNKILVGGLGLGFTSEAASKYGDVTTVEILSDAINFYKAENSEVGFEIVHGDFKDYIKSSKGSYDYILMQLDFPGYDIGYRYCLESNADMYTKEFMELITKRLAPNGVFVVEAVCEHNKATPFGRMLEKSGFHVTSNRKPFNQRSQVFDYMRFICRVKKGLFNRGEHHAQR